MTFHFLNSDYLSLLQRVIGHLRNAMSAGLIAWRWWQSRRDSDPKCNRQRCKDDTRGHEALRI